MNDGCWLSSPGSAVLPIIPHHQGSVNLLPTAFLNLIGTLCSPYSGICLEIALPACGISVWDNDLHGWSYWGRGLNGLLQRLDKSFGSVIYKLRWGISLLFFVKEQGSARWSPESFMDFCCGAVEGFIIIHYEHT